MIGAADYNGAMHDPRATRILLPAGPAITTELWMGGANTAVGEPITSDLLKDAWVIDCAGDMPDPLRSAAKLWLYRVFSDLEEIPSAWRRIDALAASVGGCLIQRGGPAIDHPSDPPARLFVLCTQGLNRSGLVMGRVLRAMGMTGADALATLTAHRPGALNNMTFTRLVLDDAC